MSLNNFEIGKVLGKGAFGSVMIVKRKEDGIIYAMKRVKIAQLTSKERENAFNEVRILASLSHSNIIGYKEAFFENLSQTLNIIMEYADDGDIASKIKKNAQFRLAFHEITIWQWLIQIIQGLQYLHDNKIMHRDLKSANIFLMKNGIIKLGDLNVSKIAKLGMAYTQTGTPYYASPEIWKDQAYDYKCDVWSVGCIIYELCTLKPPFRGTSLHQLNDNINRGIYDPIPLIYSLDLVRIIEKMLTVDPNKRPNCSQLLNSDIILKKLKEIKIELVSLAKEKVNLMKTIKLPRDIRNINKELPKKRYNKIREEMLENDEYETKKYFYKQNDKANQVNPMIYENKNYNVNENNIQRNEVKEEIDLDEINKKYFKELRDKETEREREKEKEKEFNELQEREIFRIREQQQQKKRERRQEQSKHEENQTHEQYINLNNVISNKRKNVEVININKKPEKLQEKYNQIKRINESELKKQIIHNEYKQDSDVIKNNRNYINEYLEREKDLKLKNQIMNNKHECKEQKKIKSENNNQVVKEPNDYIKNKDEIEQIKDKYKLLLIKPSELKNCDNINEFDKNHKGNNLINYRPNYIHMNNIQAAQEISQRPREINLVNHKLPRAYNAVYQHNKQFIHNYKDYLPQNHSKNIQDNNMVFPSNNKYEQRIDYHLNMNKHFSEGKKYEPIINSHYQQLLNNNHNNAYLGKNQKAVIEKLDYRNYIINKYKSNQNNPIRMHKDNFENAFAFDEKIIRNGPKLLHIKR